MSQADTNQNVRESLSAGIDGELSKEQLRFLLRRLDHDGPLQEAWVRYHLARDGLRRELPAMAAKDFASRVMLAVERESTPVAGQRHHWLRWSAGGAIAASVAAVALMVARPVGDTDRNAMAAASIAPQSHVAASFVAPAQQATSPAAIPQWLSGNSASLLSQQASATLGSPFDMNRSTGAPGPAAAYPSLYRYRTLDNKDGSYLLLLDPQQHDRPVDVRRAGAHLQ